MDTPVDEAMEELRRRRGQGVLSPSVEAAMDASMEAQETFAAASKYWDALNAIFPNVMQAITPSWGVADPALFEAIASKPFSRANVLAMSRTMIKFLEEDIEVLRSEAAMMLPDDMRCEAIRLFSLTLAAYKKELAILEALPPEPPPRGGGIPWEKAA